MIYEIKRLDLNPKKAKCDKFRWEKFPMTIDIALKREPRKIPQPK